MKSEFQIPCMALIRVSMRPQDAGNCRKISSNGAGMMLGSQIVTPSGLLTSHAIFARSRFAAKPMLHVMCSPTFWRRRRLILRARSVGLALVVESSVQASSSIDFTVSMGISHSISLSSVRYAHRNTSGRRGTRMMSGQIAIASGTRITFFRPNRLASLEHAMIVMLCVALVSNGITPTGLPRSCGIACYITDAKKPSKSRYSVFEPRRGLGCELAGRGGRHLRLRFAWRLKLAQGRFVAQDASDFSFASERVGVTKNFDGDGRAEVFGDKLRPCFLPEANCRRSKRMPSYRGGFRLVSGMILLFGIQAAMPAFLSSTAQAQTPNANLSFKAFDLPSGNPFSANGINAKGDIVGSYTSDRGITSHGFVLSSGNLSTVDFPSAPLNILQGINDTGQIVGWFWDSAFFATHGWQVGSGFQDLCGGTGQTRFFSISNASHIAGTCGPGDGFILNPGKSVIPASALPNAIQTSIYGINSFDEYVGAFTDDHGTTHGLIGNSKDGPSSVDFPGAFGTQILGINDSHQMVGQYWDANTTHGFICKLPASASCFQPFDVTINGVTALVTNPTGISSTGVIVGMYGDSAGSHGFTASSMTCPARVRFATGGGTMMQAFFTSPSGTLASYAASCGFKGFNWQQTITTLPCRSAVQAVTPSKLPAADICDNLSLNATIPFNDPPSGGYTYFAQRNRAGYDPYPFYYDSVTEAQAQESSPTGLCIFKTNAGTCVVPLVSSDGRTLGFYDAPGDPCLPGGLLLFQLQYGCASSPAPPGSYMAFKTALVGINMDGTASPPLFSWGWTDNFTGTSGGIVTIWNDGPTDPNSGTGSMTITNINGTVVPQPIPINDVTVVVSGLSYSRASQSFSGQMILRNVSSSVVSGPLQIIFFGISDGLTLIGATGDLSGTAYITIPNAGSFAPGQTISVPIQLKGPSNSSTVFSAQVFAGGLN
jgi:hypothetical protein